LADDFETTERKGQDVRKSEKKVAAEEERIVRPAEATIFTGTTNGMRTKMEAAGTFPKRITLNLEGGRACVYLLSELRAWLDAIKAKSRSEDAPDRSHLAGLGRGHKGPKRQRGRPKKTAERRTD